MTSVRDDAASMTPNVARRNLLAALGAGGALSALSQSSQAAEDDFTAADYAQAKTCSILPEETAGPYPLSEVLQDSSIVRSDITGGQTGVPMTLKLKIVNASNNCKPIANCALYIWHCNAQGVYSGYARQPGGVDTTGQTWLRGVQVSSSKGIVSFTTIFPGWYFGRVTHFHIQGYLNDELGGVATFTTQMAVDDALSSSIYSSIAPYTDKGLNNLTNETDMVFSDGYASQLLTVSGKPTKALKAKLVIGVAL